MRVGNCEKQNRNFFPAFHLPSPSFVFGVRQELRFLGRRMEETVSLLDGTWVLGIGFEEGVRVLTNITFFGCRNRLSDLTNSRRGSFCCRMSYVRKLYIWNDPFRTGIQALISGERLETNAERMAWVLWIDHDDVNAEITMLNVIWGSTTSLLRLNTSLNGKYFVLSMDHWENVAKQLFCGWMWCMESSKSTNENEFHHFSYYLSGK